MLLHTELLDRLPEWLSKKSTVLGKTRARQHSSVRNRLEDYIAKLTAADEAHA